MIRPLILRLAGECGVAVDIETKNARGGAGRVIDELRLWQRATAKNSLGEKPDVLVIVVDANSRGYHTRRGELLDVIDETQFPHVVLGCPDPHIERWLLLDADAFRAVTGSGPLATAPRGEEDHKGLFRASVVASGMPILTGEMEIAPDIIACMQFWRCVKSDASFRSFVTDLRGALQRLADSTSG